MSPSKLNSLFTGLFFAIIVALGSSVMAQDGLRLFKPYGPESFGGGRRGNDGVYSSVSGIYWTISTPTGGYIGATTNKGKDETREVYDLNTAALRTQSNSARIDMLSSDTSLATRFEIGNRRGHHGWLASGYGLLENRSRMTLTNVSMTIRDEGNFTSPPGAPILPGQVGYLWGPNFGLVERVIYVLADDVAGPNTTGWLPNPVNQEWMYYIGPNVQTGTAIDDRTIYAYIPEGQAYYVPDVQQLPGEPIIAPLPVAFDSVAVRTRAQHMSAELMYTHRLHPFTWGSMELLVGARYWDLKDDFGLAGLNILSVDGAGVTVTYGPVRAFENMIVDASGSNRVFGPQFGMKLTRHNARWTFGAEGRLTAGINAQTVRTRGYITPHRDYTPVGMQDTLNLGIRSNAVSFGHKQRKTYFSPIGELRLTADWQWTSAISFFGALDGMFAGNIARGVRVTDYVVRSDGNAPFGIRGNDRNETVFVYGVELGIKMHR